MLSKMDEMVSAQKALTNAMDDLKLRFMETRDEVIKIIDSRIGEQHRQHVQQLFQLASGRDMSSSEHTPHSM